MSFSIGQMSPKSIHFEELMESGFGRPASDVWQLGRDLILASDLVLARTPGDTP
jgi:hypothetical protein